MVADKRKRPKLAEKGGGEELVHVDEKLVFYIEKLQEAQDELEKVCDQENDEILEVEQKYIEIRRPIYSRRKEVIKLIPDFWLTAILRHPGLGDLISENDQKILKYLVSLDVEDSNDLNSDCSITFSFLPNPYFENEKLTKTISEAIASVTGTEIKWKEGMDISNGSGHEKDDTKRPLEEKSFFNWFNLTIQKTPSDGLIDEVAEIIEDLWFNPLTYFKNGKGTKEEEDDDNAAADEQDGNAKLIEAEA